jgi:hypothetical protein
LAISIVTGVTNNGELNRELGNMNIDVAVISENKKTRKGS